MGGREEWLAGTVVQKARAANRILSSLPKKSALISLCFCSSALAKDGKS